MTLRRLLLPLLLITTMFGFFHYFVYSMATQAMTQPPQWLAIAMAAGLILIPSSLLMSMTPAAPKLMPIIMVGFTWLGTFTIALFFACVQALLTLAGVEIPYPWMLIVVPAIALWALRINIFGPKIIKHTLKGPDFMRALRVVQISDLHVGSTILREKWLEGVCAKVQKLAPDVLVVTGDLADGPYARTAPMLEPLAQIKIPKFYVTGNHEYIRGGDWEARLRDLGFQVLHNTHALIHRDGGTLLIGGVPDQHVDRFRPGSESNPDRALHSDEQVGYKILLAHEPSSVFDIVKEKCDLLLAGHTHGGQIFPFRMFVRLQQPVAIGFKLIRGVLVFAHMGTGFWGPPMRWFTRCEIVEFSWA